MHLRVRALFFLCLPSVFLQAGAKNNAASDLFILKPEKKLISLQARQAGYFLPSEMTFRNFIGSLDTAEERQGGRAQAMPPCNEMK